MGLCGSSLSPEDQAEKGNDKKVEQALRDQQAADAKINKLLLLGQEQAQDSSEADVANTMPGTTAHTRDESVARATRGVLPNRANRIDTRAPLPQLPHGAPPVVPLCVPHAARV